MASFSIGVAECRHKDAAVYHSGLALYEFIHFALEGRFKVQIGRDISIQNQDQQVGKLLASAVRALPLVMQAEISPSSSAIRAIR